MFLNFHSHGPRKSSEAVVRNIIVLSAGTDCLLPEQTPAEEWFSAGIHPWYIDEVNYDSQIGRLRQLAEVSSVKMIGECGLDRLRGPDHVLQEQIFTDQILLAENLGKPVLIHCVKRFNELILIKRRNPVTVPLVVHGFNSNREIARQLLKAGFYLSFGAALLRDSSNAATVIRLVPEDRLFLETDDSSCAIELIYEAAAKLRKVSVDYLKEIIFANWINLQSRAAKRP